MKIYKYLKIIAYLWLPMAGCQTVYAESYSVNFQSVDIKEFINTVSKVLNKTIIIQPNVKGTVTVRSYESLDPEQYYQFFLNVLDVHGYSVIDEGNDVIKVVPAQLAKGSAFFVDENSSTGDALVTRVVQVKHMAVRDIVPALNKINLNNEILISSFEQSNTLLLTGKMTVTRRLIEILEQVDREEDNGISLFSLNHASATDVGQLAQKMISDGPGAEGSVAHKPRIIIDERTNSLLVAGSKTSRDYISNIIHQLDRYHDQQGNTQVIYLKYAQAKPLAEILSGVSASLEGGVNTVKSAEPALMKNTTIKADEQTNSLIITTSPALMAELKKVIERLDIRRAQVLVEAIIVELQDAEGLNLGVQWFNKHGGGTNFPDNNGSAINLAKNNSLAEVIKGMSGLALGFHNNNWAGLLNALKTNSNNDILATPSIVTLDNMEAEFNVGQEVPVLTGSQTTNSDNIFNTVERKNVGIKLKVKPQINQGDSVVLKIEQEVSSVADASNSATEGLGATFNTRTINNTVLVGSGETVVVGGLLDTTQSDVQSKVPLLGDIPLVGELFRSTTTKKVKRNLLLFIRPTIIRSGENYGQQTLHKFAQFEALQPERKQPLALPTELTELAPANDKSLTFKQVAGQIAQFNQYGKHTDEQK
nr:type II secretion system secretin GspD [Mixta theicola]